MNHMINADELEAVFNEKLSTELKEKINNYKLTYASVDNEERDRYLLKIIEVLLHDDLVEAGVHRLLDWEKGWGENRDQYDKNANFESLMPKYFGKYGLIRWKQQLVKPVSYNFDYYILAVILDWIFEKYRIFEFDNIYEFGCGTGHNLFRIREFNKHAKLWGLDWATSSQEIIEKYAIEQRDMNLFAQRFDFFNPNFEFRIQPNSLIYTVESIEQIGNQYELFVQYLLDQQPMLCIHIEPISELLDSTNLLDYLSIKYIEKRKYLSGYYDYLLKLEKMGNLKILQAQRTYVGSLFVEGYSVIAWSPIEVNQ